MSRGARAASKYTKDYQRINPFHQLQAEAFKQFFSKPKAWPGDRANALGYQRHQLESMFFRVNSLVLALHRQHLPLLFYVKPDDSRMQRLLQKYALVCLPP